MKPLRNINTDPCTEFLENIDAFREGRLTDDVWPALESHRLVCKRCRDALVEEEKFARLMSEIPLVEVPPDFRDNVLRKWRLKRDSVKDAIPVKTIRTLQIAFAAIIVALILLPIVRIQLLASSGNLLKAFDRVPPELREGLEITFNIPTWAEIAAWFQVWQGRLFGFLGDSGSVLAPWSGWLWFAFTVSVAVGVINLHAYHSRLSIEAIDKAQ